MYSFSGRLADKSLQLVQRGVGDDFQAYRQSVNNYCTEGSATD